MYSKANENESVRPPDTSGVCCENMEDMCAKAQSAEDESFVNEDYPCTCL